MYSNPVLTGLRREKALLEQVLELAECQLELVRSGRLEDAVILLFLRAEPMNELVSAEVNVGREMPLIERSERLTPNELEELHDLNVLIMNLANQIADIDDRVYELADLNDACLGPDVPPQTEPC
jgi:hypothetical protein